MPVLVGLPVRAPGLPTWSTSLSVPGRRRRRRWAVSVSSGAGRAARAACSGRASRTARGASGAGAALSRLRQGVEWR